MKIVFSIDHLYLHGGAEKVLVDRANYFADVHNYRIYIITTEQRNKKSRYTISDKITMIDLGINYKRDKSYFSSQNLRKIIAHFRIQKRTLEKIEPDFVLVFNYSFDFYWTPFINRSSKKIKEYHGSQFKRLSQNSSLQNKIRSWIQNLVEQKYNGIVLLNPDEQQFFKSDNTFVIPNPIEIKDYEAKLGTKKVIAAGRIAPVKGFERLINVWALVQKEYPDCSLDIYGEDYLETQAKLQVQINSLQLSETITFKGTVENLTEVMCNYSVYAMTSHSECFPMVLLEALSVGLPIVAFDVPTGPRNIISDIEDGFLVEDGDVEEFAKKLMLFFKLENKSIRMGASAKENIVRFSRDVVMKNWVNMLEDFNSKKI